MRQIYEAGDAAHAVQLVRKSPPDIAFVDYKLEGEGGLLFCQSVRADSDPILRYLPIIMISAYSEHAKVLEAINAGVDEFLVKPIRPKDVASRINAVIERRRNFVETGDYFGPCRRRRVNPRYKGPLRRFDDGGDFEI